MAKEKFDGIVEAIRLDENGQLKIARIYERRGAVVSDHFLVDRDTLISKLKQGQKFYSGKRIYKMGSDFETGHQLHVVSSNGQEAITVGEKDVQKDNLEGLPIF